MPPTTQQTSHPLGTRGREFHTHVLATGTRITAIHSPEARNLSLSLAIPAGMRAEKPGEEGMLHLLEHMVYQDSEEITALKRQADLHSFGGVLGGNTHLDYTEFYETGHLGHLHKAAQRILEQVFHPALKEAQILEQIHAVAAERKNRLATAPGQVRPWPHLTSYFWQDHPNRHDGTGDLDLLDRATPSKLRELHQRHYRPEEAVLTVLAPGDPSEALDVLAEAVEPYRPSKHPAQAIPNGQRATPVGHLYDGKTSGPHRLISATSAAESYSTSTDLVGDIIAAELLSQHPKVDASAGIFGPADTPKDDLFIVVDDSNSGISLTERLRALSQVNTRVLTQAALTGAFSIEKLLHDDERLTRTLSRDLLLRNDADFMSHLFTTLLDLSEHPDHTRNIVGKTTQRLTQEDFTSLSVSLEGAP